MRTLCFSSLCWSSLLTRVSVGPFGISFSTSTDACAVENLYPGLVGLQFSHGLGDDLDPGAAVENRLTVTLGARPRRMQIPRLSNIAREEEITTISLGKQLFRCLLTSNAGLLENEVIKGSLGVAYLQQRQFR